jgi:hypothetical protein
MELSEGLKRPTETIIGVLTGDGRTEFRILSVIARKYNGSRKVLYFPKRPSFFTGKGFSPLKATKILVSKYNIRKFFYLIDKEHFNEKETVEKRIGKELREIGITPSIIQNFTVNEENALHVKGTIGSHNFILWIVVTGKKKRIEENIAELIKVTLKKNVKPTKEEIRKILREYDIEQLLVNSSIEHIRICFPALDLILSKIERNDTENCQSRYTFKD